MEGELQRQASSLSLGAPRLNTKGRPGDHGNIYLKASPPPIAVDFDLRMCVFGISGSIWSFISVRMWSQLLLDFQEFLKIIPADKKNLSYFLLIYSLKMFSAILWDLGSKEN